MKNIFIAIGGSGTRVAEALVRLLAVGFPTRVENGVLTGAGDSLQIWRVDPDRSSGARVALQACVDSYEELQGFLGNIKGSNAESRWAMDLDLQIRDLDPLQLSTAQDTDKNETKTLRGILNSGDGKISSEAFLNAFYEQKDLEISVDRGFYQKPFIGAPIIAIFAHSLDNENSPGGSQCKLTPLENQQVRFFLCGSVHGGTGACGLPIMGRFLYNRRFEKKLEDKWRIGGCLLAPYCIPPQPPFTSLDDAQDISDDIIDQHLKDYGNLPAFSGLTPEEKRELIKQILLGFYADPKEMEARARHSLVYYKEHSRAYFDQLYLVGKLEPDELKVWSNGGKSQRNPMNSAEVVGALAALNFFSGSKVGDNESYVIGSSTKSLNSHKMHLHDLPQYKMGGQTIDPERVLLATAILRHLLLYQIPWDVETKSWPHSIEGLRKFYLSNEQRKEEDRLFYSKTAKLIADSMLSLVDSRETLGWDEEDANQLRKLLSDDLSVVEEITKKLARKGFTGKEAKGATTLGSSSIKVSTIEFGEWCPPGDAFTRGEYLRFVWSKLFTKDQKK